MSWKDSLDCLGFGKRDFTARLETKSTDFYQEFKLYKIYNISRAFGAKKRFIDQFNIIKKNKISIQEFWLIFQFFPLKAQLVERG